MGVVAHDCTKYHLTEWVHCYTQRTSLQKEGNMKLPRHDVKVFLFGYTVGGSLMGLICWLWEQL